MTIGAQDPLSRPLADVPRLLWHWWRREIAATIPAPFKQWLAWRHGRLIVTILHDQATFFEDSGGRRRRLGVLDLADADPAAVGHLASFADDCVLEFPSDAALRREVALPLAAEANLAEVVSFELERNTPFRRAEAYHGFKIIGRDVARHRVRIELTVLPRSIVDDALSRLTLAGIDVGVVRVADDEVAAAASPNLLPVRPAVRGRRLPRVAVLLLALAAGSLSVAAIAIPILRAHLEADRLDAALQVAKQQASDSAHVQKEIDALERARGFLAGRKRQILPVSRLLDVVTQLLPDDTWLTEMRVAGQDFQIIGTSASASAIVALIDGAAGLSAAEFRSPVTQDRLHREQFDIGAHLGPAAGR